MEYYDLGSYGRIVTTSSAEAQKWFDRGLVWTYAFHHEEAVACFEEAVRADPECAMAHWGIAYALGPNYNKPWEFFDDQDLARTVRRTHEAVERAVERAARSRPVERALIGALRARYPRAQAAEDCSVWNHAYADAMEAVYALAPDDLDVAALYAEALMNLTPWQLWDLRTGEPAHGARTREARDVLERALAADPEGAHPGLPHLYVHLMEMSPTPEAALTVADRLRGLVPDAGHLLHMPSHLEVLCGDYRRAVADNTAAITADAKAHARGGAMNFYTLYRAHNHHFRIYGAMFLGASKTALERSVELSDNLPYDEPWGWMQPTRHAYGALLLEQGRVTEAEAVYRADLGLDPTLPRALQHPGNVWALHGLHECLVRLGKHGEAALIGQQLTLARALADVPVESSCFCRGRSTGRGCCDEAL
ncbi:hypothetical protein QD712_10075 [Streptomyces acidiscabies]|uniref:hypothetical protein n=1 Tax=Streptomyces acidiscabies TaxID=42234 RepID=UPI0030D1FB80